MKKTAIALLCILSCAQAHAAPKQPVITPYKCKPTPSLKVNFPDSMGKTNNLWRKTGLAMPALGRPIYIRGIVMDSNCTPVPNAVVQIWQADAKGHYAIGKPSKENPVDPYFTPSGTTISDTSGKYSFLTIFPGSEKNEAPYIRIRVKHEDFSLLRTKLFFEDYADNQKDTDYKALKAEERSLLTAVGDPTGLKDIKTPDTYYFNITLQGVARYKQY